MASGLNMKVLLSLQTKQFNQGINQVKKSLNGLKNTFLGVAGAIAGGLGFSKIISELKNTSVEMSTAKAMLQNVSTEVNKAGGTLDHYAENLSFIKKLSKDYHQDQLMLIKGFAQFSAAAKTCNVSLDNQRFIYEALTRAAAGYHMSASQSNDMMLAVTQMMSKGKVAAEELRRQLGNSLPGAFGIMAAALGVSNSQLEDMMRKGQILAGDALPKFAHALNEITANMSFDSLQGSLNDFKNAWYNFVNSSQFQKFYQGVVNISTKGLEALTQNFRQVKSIAIGAVAAVTNFIALKTGFGSINSLIEKGNISFSKMRNEIDACYAANDKLEKSNKQLFNTLSKTQGGYLQLPTQGKLTDKELANIKEYNDNLLKIHKNSANMGQSFGVTKNETKQIKNQSKEIAKNLKNSGYYVDGFTKTSSKLSQLWKGIAVTFKSIAVSTAVMAAFSAIVGFAAKWLSYMKQIKDEWKRINNIVNEYDSSQEKIATNFTDEQVELAKCQLILRDSSKSFAEHKYAVEKINEKLGLTGDKAYDVKKIFDNTGKLINGEIITAVDTWIMKMKLLAQASSNVNEIMQKENANTQLNSQLDELAKQYEKKTGSALWGLIDRRTGKTTEQGEKYGVKDKGWIKRKVQPIIAEIIANNAVIDKANAKLDETTKKLAETYNVDWYANDSGNGNGSAGSSIEDLQKAIDKYKESLKELQNQKKNGAITEEEYQSELAKTQESSWKAIAAFDELEEKLKALGSEYQKTVEDLKMDVLVNNMLSSIQDEIEEADKALDKELDEMLKKEQEYFNKVLEITDKPLPTKGSRNNFFDYKSSQSEQFGGEADIADDYVKSLEDYRDELVDLQKEYGKLDNYGQHALSTVLQLLSQAKNEAKDLRDKAQIAEWIEDVNKLGEAYNSALIDGFSDAASTFGSFASGVHQVAEAMATLSGEELDEDFEEMYNKIDAVIGILNTLVQTINTITSVTESLRKVEEAETAFRKAASKEELYDMAVKLGLISTEEAAQKKNAVTTVAAETTKQAAAAATTTALGAEAVAGAASSVAGVPIVGPALAAAAVAAIVAILASNMNKFAKGGIVGGTSTQGDNNVVRANSGEMILTKGQQGTLFNMLNGKGGIGGNVEFKIRGADLVGTISNYSSRKRG